MRWWLVPMTILTVACSENKRPCGGKILVLWPSAAGEYAPRVVATPTLADARVLRGPVANVYFESQPGDRGFRGQAAEPHLTNSGDVCVPTDTGSAVALSAYAQFERLYDFDRQLGVSDQVSWPRNVGVETKLHGSVSDVHDNAHYVGDKDLVVLVPTTMDGVPVAMNLGVTAHEHFHAHFQSQVLNALSIRSATNATVSLLPDFVSDLIDAGNAEVRARGTEFVLRGWNEGLADFYAAVYLNRPEFLRVSFGDAVAARGRTMEGDALALRSNEIYREAEVMGRSESFAATSTRDRLKGLAYGQGVALGRALWTVVRTDPTATPAQNLAKMMKSLEALPTVLNARSTEGRLNAGFVLSVLLRDVNVSPEACATLARVTDSPEALQRLASCRSF